MNSGKMIGIVGGVGPYAGIDLCNKIFDNTVSTKDQDHVPVALLSIPWQIEDRTSYLLGKTQVNPAYAISDIIKKLESMGADVIGVPCNTVHAPQIFDVIWQELKNSNSRIKLVHMIDEVVGYMGKYYDGIKNIGVLSTTGAYKVKIYKNSLEQKGYRVIIPSESLQNNDIHDSIYHPEYGIKSKNNPVTAKAMEKLFEGIRYLQAQGAEAIILGCTEIPLAIRDKVIGGTFIIDATVVLARALIREVACHKLKPVSI